MVKRVIIVILSIILMLAAFILGINFFVIESTKHRIITEEQAKELEDVDCILVLGAAIWGDEPCPMLEDRLLQGISLYHNGTSSKIIMSGEHTTDEYDEVTVMKNFAIEKNVKSEDIFKDHYGSSTYESIYRAKEVFQAKKIVIVSQDYHLYRAIYIAEQLGIEAYGVAANPRKYYGQVYRDIREIFARNKDWFQCIIKPKIETLEDAIPVSGNGDVTNEKD